MGKKRMKKKGGNNDLKKKRKKKRKEKKKKRKEKLKTLVKNESKAFSASVLVGVVPKGSTFEGTSLLTSIYLKSG